jgi:hypothetical protein
MLLPIRRNYIIGPLEGTTLSQGPKKYNGREKQSAARCRGRQGE